MSLGRTQSTTEQAVAEGDGLCLQGPAAHPLVIARKVTHQKCYTQWEFPAAPRESRSLLPPGAVELHTKLSSSCPTSPFSPRSRPRGRAKPQRELGKEAKTQLGAALPPRALKS